MLAGVPARAGSNLGCEQIHDRSVFVGRPDRTVVAKKTSSGTFFAAKTDGPINQTGHKPLKADRNFAELTAKLLDYSVNHAAAHQRLSNSDISAPLRTVCEQISDADCEVVVRVHQSRNRSDNPVPVRVRIVGESHLILILQSYKPRHCIRAGTIHADLSIVIYCHERKRRINGWVHDSDIQSVNRIDRLPIWAR